jgi:hypothetical protein
MSLCKQVKISRAIYYTFAKLRSRLEWFSRTVVTLTNCPANPKRSHQMGAVSAVG